MPTASQSLSKFPSFHRIRRLIAMLTRARIPTKQGASAPEETDISKIGTYRNKKIQQAKPQTEQMHGCSTLPT